VRIATHTGFKRVRPGYLVPRPRLTEPAQPLGRALQLLKRLFIGAPIPTALEGDERLTKVKALAVFSSDALSSVAYATEEIMKVVVLGGLGLLSITWTSTWSRSMWRKRKSTLNASVASGRSGSLASIW